jgi:hypothetical protein
MARRTRATQASEMIGNARDQSPELDRSPAVAWLRPYKIGYSSGFDTRLAERALDQRIAADQPATAIGEESIRRQGCAAVSITLGLEPLHSQFSPHPPGYCLRDREVEAAVVAAPVHEP